MYTAILVDGGFYRRRAQSVYGTKTPQERANELEEYCKKLLHKEKAGSCLLYRIFYYDCPPMGKKIYNPYTKKQVDCSSTDLYKWMNDFLSELKKHRKFALRMGKLSEAQAHYELAPDVLKKLCNGKIEFENLTESDFKLAIDQKGVDMKIGLDIASLAYKKQVQQILLISGDSDFVPAAKLARREGIDFILDPMGANIKDDLFEHIDGLRSCVPKKK